MTPPRLIVIGASLGGLKALRTVLGALPAALASTPVALVVAQHRHGSGGDALEKLIGEVCALPVREATDKAPIEPGTVTLAPADYHLLVEGEHFALEAAKPTDAFCPSIDALFESAAERKGVALIGVVLTGTGDDGSRGLVAIAKAGGRVLVQSPASAEAREMPKAALAAVGAAAEPLRLSRIAKRLVELAGGG